MVKVFCLSPFTYFPFDKNSETLPKIHYFIAIITKKCFIFGCRQFELE